MFHLNGVYNDINMDKLHYFFVEIEMKNVYTHREISKYQYIIIVM